MCERELMCVYVCVREKWCVCVFAHQVFLVCVYSVKGTQDTYIVHTVISS